MSMIDARRWGPLVLYGHWRGHSLQAISRASCDLSPVGCTMFEVSSTSVTRGALRRLHIVSTSRTMRTHAIASLVFARLEPQTHTHVTCSTVPIYSVVCTNTPPWPKATHANQISHPKHGKRTVNRASDLDRRSHCPSWPLHNLVSIVAPQPARRIAQSRFPSSRVLDTPNPTASTGD